MNNKKIIISFLHNVQRYGFLGMLDGFTKKKKKNHPKQLQTTRVAFPCESVSLTGAL